jgi:NAD(P)-dependent dehydrogenase (short-subunit alcohol dehydrogenase family)
MGTYCVTGTASGMGLATRARLEADGHQVIGVDQRDAEVIANLATADGRAAAVAAVTERCGGELNGIVPCAGVGGVGGAEITVRVNFFGTLAVVEGLQPLLVGRENAAVVMLSSNSTTMTPGLKISDAEVYLAGDEEAAVAHFSTEGAMWNAYPAGKLAIAFWVRQQAVTASWIGAGIRLNAVAPGVIDTNMTRPLLEMPGIADALKQIPIPAGRWGNAEELASVITFLLSPGAAYIVGQTIFADGGTDALLQPRSHPRPL